MTAASDKEAQFWDATTREIRISVWQRAGFLAAFSCIGFGEMDRRMPEVAQVLRAQIRSMGAFKQWARRW